MKKQITPADTEVGFRKIKYLTNPGWLPERMEISGVCASIIIRVRHPACLGNR